MKISVDISEVFSEGDEGSLESQLIDAIKHEVVCEIKKRTREQVEKMITDQVTKAVRELAEQEIYEVIKRTVSGVSFVNPNSEELVTVDAYIKERLEKDCGYYYPALTKHIDELTRNFAKTLKDKYDMAFSAQIVSALNNQGLLKEDVVKKLGEYQRDDAK